MVARRTGRAPVVSSSRHANSFESLEGRRLLAAIAVTSTADSTAAGTLRAAVVAANAATSATTITFDPVVFATKKTISLTGTALNLSNTKHAITLTGPAAGVTIDANGASRVFAVGQGVTATLSNLTATRGIANYGGDVYNNGFLTLNAVSLTGGKSTLGSYGGGGIYSTPGAGTGTGSLTMNNCTVSGNASNNVGGGILIEGTAALLQVTVANNTAAAQGGGLFSTGFTTVKDCTVSGNTVTSGYFLDGGGGIASRLNPSGSSTFTIANTVIAANTSAAGEPDVYGNFGSQGNNLIGKTDGASGFVATDRTGTVAKPLDAKLASLANNGGLTMTMLPLAASPAIDHGNNALVPAGTGKDQRGLTRVVNSTVDIGAVEVQTPAATGSIAGTVFKDADGDGVKDAGETGLGGVAVYVDADGDSVKDAGESFATTDASGNYKILGLAAGTFKVRQVLPTGHTQSLPSANAAIGVTLTAGQSVTGKNFGDKPVASNSAAIGGTVFGDSDADGVFDAAEIGLGLWTVYLDANKNGKPDSGEKTSTTDITGAWAFTGLAAGTYVVRVVQPTKTATTTASSLSITLADGQASTGKLFGEKRIA